MSRFLTQEDFENIFTSHLKIETYSKSIDSLFSLRSLNKIDFSPYYQRNYVWDIHKATYFIESILLGTEIPPLIFFNNGSNIEVIDGRQRFETIKRFKENSFPLTKRGLGALKQLSKSTYESLLKNSETSSIINLFLDAKIRIIEFEIVKEPKLDPILEDKVKKEIFGRYNSGITPLNKSDIDNAVYDSDLVFQHFKDFVNNNPNFCEIVHNLFLRKSDTTNNYDTGKILQFIRRYLVLHRFPIRYYSWGNNRTETLDKLYEHMINQVSDEVQAKQLCESFLEKVELVNEIHDFFSNQELKINRNRFVSECLLWIFQVLDEESIDLAKVTNPHFLKPLGQEISKNLDKFSNSSSNSPYYSRIERFSFIANFFENKLNISLLSYVGGDKERRDNLNRIRKGSTDDTDTVTKLSELDSLRVTKPEPSRNSIDDIARVMGRNMFLVRPSYQRKEVINTSKASSIIESILLDISLPPIFIYKRKDGISEVIDGQQRLLTILGFIGQKYLDENSNQCETKNSGFSLKGLKILTHLKNKSWNDLKKIDSSLQDKILDFELFVVEIQESLNPEFNPVDLFVRLNNKPYPIKENSFEMWNSWVDRVIIEKIKKNSGNCRDWFYIKRLKDKDDRDRMENEELYTYLAYLEYQCIQSKGDYDKYLYFYDKNDGISIRIRSSLAITKLLQNATEDDKVKDNFLKAIKNLESLIKKVKIILLDRDLENNEELHTFLNEELDTLFKAKRQRCSFRKTRPDFYILWYLLSSLNLEMVKFHRLDIKKDITRIFYLLRNSSEGFSKKDFILEAQKFHDKYAVEGRKIKLSKVDKLSKLREQDNRCPISGAPLFRGDDIEVDHELPLSIGGADSKDNLQITHSDSNRKKGSKHSY